MENEKPPVAPFELRVSISGDTWFDVITELQRLSAHVEAHGPECQSFGGGAGRSHSVTVVQRDVTPEQYREELAAWHERYMANLTPVSAAHLEGEKL